MQQITYISTAREEPTPEQIEAILFQSRRNNLRDQLTGLLLCGGRRFLQVLEGPEQQLAAAYARIKRDPRHFALVELGRKPITDRSFPHWDMGFQPGAAADGFEDLIAVVSRMTETVDDPSLRAHLRGFAELHARAA